MKQVIEIYVGLWVLLFMFLLAVAFTSINLHITQARKIYNDIRAEVQASNGAILNVPSWSAAEKQALADSMGVTFKDKYPDNTPGMVNTKRILAESKAQYSDKGYHYSFSVVRQGDMLSGIGSNDESFIYNDTYKISLLYEYYVPLFGKQVYPLTGYAY